MECTLAVVNSFSLALHCLICLHIVRFLFVLISFQKKTLREDSDRCHLKDSVFNSTCYMLPEGSRVREIILNTRPPNSLWVKVIYALSKTTTSYFCISYRHCHCWLLFLDYDSTISDDTPLCHSDIVASEGLGASPFHGWTWRLLRSWRVCLPLGDCGTGTCSFGFTDYLVRPFFGFHSPGSSLHI